MKLEDDLPIYSISAASELLKVHPRTIRTYEKEGLVNPTRKGGKRFYSENDILWIKCIRNFIHEENLSIPGIRKLLELVPCYQLKNCSKESIEKCSVLKKRKKHCWQYTKSLCSQACESCKEYKKNTEIT